MDDPHQVNSIIATAISEFFKGHPDAQCGIEEAKLLAKQIVQALNEAGLRVAPVDLAPPTR
ncbi:hypothetical protein [Bradyrhizobium barranii]|uniref:Uncharacterized protein n=1 Tax=Bradyrhizobium barranii subsp. barranii TaxID=2823807 RepID=A0A939M317_9BRAD|nr:hypothetical protein [Bradyrhizobium barranii]UEM14938.1 hypothetical protein J4G43_012280 [Bradyrhizobium barranii subsp. barranii]